MIRITGLMLPVMLLGACSGGKDKIADRVEENADHRAEAMEEASESMSNALQQNAVEQQADTVRAAGEERAEAIRDSDLKASLLTKEQKKELVRGETATGTAEKVPR